MTANRRSRRDCAQVTLRMDPQERDVIRSAIPAGELNAVARRLLLNYARDVRAHGRLPLEEDATTAA